MKVIMVKNRIIWKSSRDTNLAYQIFEQRYSECGNNKILISLAHVEYTQAVVLCHKCNINNYKNIDENTRAILTLSSALASPHNSYDYAKKIILIMIMWFWNFLIKLWKTIQQ